MPPNLLKGERNQQFAEDFKPISRSEAKNNYRYHSDLTIEHAKMIYNTEESIDILTISYRISKKVQGSNDKAVLSLRSK